MPLSDAKIGRQLFLKSTPSESSNPFADGYQVHPGSSDHNKILLASVAEFCLEYSLRNILFGIFALLPVPTVVCYLLTINRARHQYQNRYSQRNRSPMTQRMNTEITQNKWGQLPQVAIANLQNLTKRYSLSIASGDLIYLRGTWYITHTALLRIAEQKRCSGILVSPLHTFCDPVHSRWIFKATVYKRPGCKGFVGYGDADPSNVSQAFRGAEMRIAETRAVSRALRKAYGIGICSAEELGSASPTFDNARKITPQSENGNGNRGGPKLRDRLCQLIRQHRLDANLVKCYAVEFCGTKTLREATREQVEAFVAHLAEWAQKDRNALLSQLNSYLLPQTETKEAGAA